jgi:hypothetical protein
VTQNCATTGIPAPQIEFTDALLFWIKPNITTKWLALLGIQEVLVSNLVPVTGYPDRFFLCGCPQSLKANAGIIP